MSDSREVADRLYRDRFPQMVGSLVRQYGDISLAEECAQEAFVIALDRWPEDGLPSDPAAWLARTASNRAIDRIRRNRTGQRLERTAAQDAVRESIDALEPAVTPQLIANDRLRTVFACCHPELGQDAQLTLTLRLVVGLSVEEIARALLIGEATVAQRLVRAKRQLRTASPSMDLPQRDELEQRVDSVLLVCYLMFNEGHSTTSGPVAVRGDLFSEAIWLVRLVVALLPDATDARALLALLLLHDARRPARFDEDGRIVQLEHHDRSRYRRERIDEGIATLDGVMERGSPGSYALQAAIAAEHCLAANWDDTDWRAIVAYYDALMRLEPSPVFALNRAVAIGMRDGAQAGYRHVEALTAGGRLTTYGPLFAVQADFLVRLGRHADAITAYDQAIALTKNVAEQTFLAGRRAECTEALEQD